MSVIRSLVQIQCLNNIMSEQEVINLISTNDLIKIKSIDEHPHFAAYSICHEGQSQPKIIGNDKVPPITWTRKAVQSLKNIILKGIKFFKGKTHNKDNSTEGRKEYGEVIANTEKEINGKLHHVVVGYFPDKKVLDENDICSQEGEWNFIQSAKQWVADSVDRVTGILLGNSKESTPAFSGAKQLVTVQAFSTESGDIKNNTPGKGEKKEGNIMDLTTVNFNDLIQEMKRRNIRPGDLFTWEDVKGDRRFNEEFKKIDDKDKILLEKEAKLKEYEKTTEEFKAKELKLTVPDRIKKIADEKKLSESQMKFVVDTLKVDKITDVSDDGLKNYLDSQLDNYSALCKIHDIKIDLPGQKEGELSQQEGDKTDINTPDGNEYLIKD